MPWTTIPQESVLVSEARSAFFHDSYEVDYVGQETTAIAVAARLAQATPVWFEWLMQVRNRAVQLVGLKDLGRFGAVDTSGRHSYRVGERFGIFVLRSITPHEVILEEDDRHLRVRLSVHLSASAPRKVTVTTVVHVHNALGYAYLLFVVPVHKLITPPFMGKARRLP